MFKPRFLNILIDSSSLNIFSSLLLHLRQIIERTDAFFRMYILGFIDFLYLPQTFQLILLIDSFQYYFIINWYTLKNFYNLT